MKPFSHQSLVFGLCLCTLIGCGDDALNPLAITWSFETGDCATNNVETVRVTITPEGGDALEQEFPCESARGSFEGSYTGSHTVLADGLDASGTIVANSFDRTVSFGESGPLGDVNVTLRPKREDVVVTWSIDGRACPVGVIVPFFVSLYETTDGTSMGDQISEVQETCSKQEATLESIPPGEYILELDSRAVTPTIQATRQVRVEPGQSTQVEIEI